MNKNTIWACAINNMISVSCFTVLAVMFDRWWIVLFALLFFTIPKSTAERYYRICDGCGKHSPYADSYNEALEKAKAAGWVHQVDCNKDYCPSCQMEF